MQTPLSTPAEAAALGYNVAAPLIARASVRIRTYARTAWIEEHIGHDWLVDLTGAVATRLDGMSDALATGITSESAGGESVSYGADAYAGVTSLTAAEKAVIDDRRPSKGIGLILLVA